MGVSKVSWFKWSDVCKPKQKGRLGVQILRLLTWPLWSNIGWSWSQVIQVSSVRLYLLDMSLLLSHPWCKFDLIVFVLPSLGGNVWFFLDPKKTIPLVDLWIVLIRVWSCRQTLYWMNHGLGQRPNILFPVLFSITY